MGDRGGRLLAAAGVMAIMSTALFWPGFADYDSVAQFEQAVSGSYQDWHPPVMARLWSLLHEALGGGAGPMLVVQLGLYWLGLGLLAAALARTGRGRAGAAVLLVGAWPLFLGWQAHILKDAQMAGAALAAVGLVAWWRLRGRALPSWAWLVVAVLLAYAMLVRANAVFALAPLVAGLIPARPASRVALTAGLTIAVLGVSGLINHGLLRAERTGVERTEALYDLAGIAVRVADPAGTGLDLAMVRRLRERHCVKPFFWDPLGEPDRCDGVIEPLRARDAKSLYVSLAQSALRHPLAYALHRLAHLNSTTRWLVPAGWPSAGPPGANQPNDDGLVDPAGPARRFERIAGWCAETPFGWPIAYIAAALVAAVLALRRRPAPARDLALALLASALGLEASFAVLSIASDLRYHLWPMLATALALLLFLPLHRSERRVALAGLLFWSLILAAGCVARAWLPSPPASYAAMLVA